MSRGSPHSSCSCAEILDLPSAVKNNENENIPKSIDELSVIIEEPVSTTVRLLKLITYSRRKMNGNLLDFDIDSVVEWVKITIKRYWTHYYHYHTRYGSFDYGHNFDPKNMPSNIYKQYLNNIELDELNIYQILKIFPNLQTPLPDVFNENESVCSPWEIEAGPELELDSRPPSNVYPENESDSDEEYNPNNEKHFHCRRRGRPKSKTNTRILGANVSKRTRKIASKRARKNVSKRCTEKKIDI